MVRGAALLTIDRFRHLCKKLFEKLGERFQRPGIAHLKEQVKMRLCLRVREEVEAVRSGKLTKGDVGLGAQAVAILATGVLFRGVLGHMQEGSPLALSKLLGGSGRAASRTVIRRQPSNGHTGGLRENGNGTKVWGIVRFDGAAKGNPGTAGAGATLSAWDPPYQQPDSEFMGMQTNNVAEYGGMILGLRLA